MHKRQFAIEEVDLGVTRPETTRILIAQAVWPKDTFVTRRGLYFHRDPERAGRYCERILTQARLDTVQLVVFPELSIPYEILEQVRLFSAETGTIVVAGSHYFQSKKGWIARSPIYINGTPSFTEKIQPSPHERNANVGEGAEPGEKIYWFRNTSAGNFAIAICSDYLDELHHALPLDEIDILCVPAFQRRSDEYHPRMQIQVGKSRSGIYVAYANTDYEPLGDGRSALFALMDRLYLDQLKETGWTDGNPPCKVAEIPKGGGYIIADLDLKVKLPLINRSVKTEPNVRVFPRNDAGVQAEHFSRSVQLFDDRYLRIRELFVPPKNYEALRTKLERDKILFIVGDPGIGKTYTAAHLLREYFDDGYAVEWYIGQDEQRAKQSLEHFRPEPKQIVHFEDPFGRTVSETADRRSLGPLIDHLSDVDARVIVTSQREVYQRFLDGSKVAGDLDKYTEYLTVGSYDIEALRRIFESIGSTVGWFSDPACRQAIAMEIERGRLATPMSIRHFVYSSERVESLETLRERLQRRMTEEKGVFAEEIICARLRSKVVLTLVFLYGAQPVATLAEWFNEAMAMYRPSRKSSGTVPLLEALRIQTGYRIEQYGMRATVYRFTHRLYEEALAIAVMSDADMADIARTVAAIVAKSNVRTCVDGIARRAVKYPDMALHVLQEIAPVITGNADLFDLTQVCSRLLGVHAETGDERLLDALEAIVTLPELINRVNADPEVKRLGSALRLCFNYAWRLSSKGRTEHDWKGLLSSSLDWGAQENAWRSASTLSQQLEALWWASRIDRQRVQKYIRAIPSGELRPAFAALTQDEKERFLNIARKLPIVRELKPQVTADRLETKRKRATKWLDSAERNGTRGVVIDKGAIAKVVMQMKRANLLPVGVVDTVGEFERNQAISIFDEQRNVLAAGVTNYSSAEIRAIHGRHSSRRSEARVPDRGAAIIPHDTIVTKTG
jgi:predicted amidohydrolase